MANIEKHRRINKRSPLDVFLLLAIFINVGVAIYSIVFPLEMLDIMVGDLVKQMLPSFISENAQSNAFALRKVGNNYGAGFHGFFIFEYLFLIATTLISITLSLVFSKKISYLQNLNAIPLYLLTGGFLLFAFHVFFNKDVFGAGDGDFYGLFRPPIGTLALAFGLISVPYSVSITIASTRYKLMR